MIKLSFRQSLVKPPQEGKPYLLVCAFFFISGAAALTYEILWVRLLGLIFGNTTYAISAVLTIYMAGLGLGSYLLGGRADRWRRPLWTYGWLEIGIGTYAVFTFRLLEKVQQLYVAFAHHFSPSLGLLTALRLALSSSILFIPTFLMGATLPALAKFYIQRTETIGPRTALLYGLNTGGAVCGTLLAGFLLLPVLGMRATLAVTVTLNIGIGVLACLLSYEIREGQSKPAGSPGFEDRSRESRPSAWLLAGLVVSGAAAMTYEVAWTRALAAGLGSSTYAFTLMLATFLLGLALGSAAAQRVLTRRRGRISDWAGLQITIALSALLTVPLFDRLGIVTVRLFALTGGNPVWLEAMRFWICAGLMVVPTLCFGALLPVSIALSTKDPALLGRDLGTLYLANTFGNILGSLGAGFLLIPTIGIYRTLLITIAVGGSLGVGIALFDRPLSPRRTAAIGAIFLCLVGGWWSLRGGWNPRLLTSGLNVRPQGSVALKTRSILERLYDRQILFYREGINSIISVVQDEDTRALAVNGKIDASTGFDMQTQILSAHLPLLLHPDPHRILVIGFGSGTTLGCVLAHPVSRAECAEIEPAVIAAAPFFDGINHRSYRDPRAHVIMNDGRNHLLIERGTYDGIISEPPNPWMAGVSTLFTVEFYQLVREHLAPGGIFCQWLQAYSIHPYDFQMVVASVGHVFPHVTIWATLPGDFLIIAAQQPILFDLDRIQARLDGSARIREDLSLFGIRGAAGLLSSFWLGEEDVKKYTRSAALHTDDQLLLEFNSPWDLYENWTESIQRRLDTYRTQPFPPLRTHGIDLLQNPQALDQIAEAHLYNNAFLEARKYFQTALDQDPHLSHAQIGLGRSFLAEGKLLKAIAQFEGAVRQDPQSADGRGYLGLALLKGGDLDGGLKALQEARRIGHNNPEFLMGEAQALKNMNRQEEAAEAYRRSLSGRPETLNTKLALVQSLVEAGRTEEAAQFLKSLPPEYATRAPVALALAHVYEKMGDQRLALAAAEAAVRINPYRVEYRAYRAQLTKPSDNHTPPSKFERGEGELQTGAATQR